jgi:hypothetical protein
MQIMCRASVSQTLPSAGRSVGACKTDALPKAILLHAPRSDSPRSAAELTLRFALRDDGIAAIGGAHLTGSVTRIHASTAQLQPPRGRAEIAGLLGREPLSSGFAHAFGVILHGSFAHRVAFDLAGLLL